MSLDDVKSRFIVDESVLRTRLEVLAESALRHCVLDRQGRVHISTSSLIAKEKIQLVLSARALGAQLDSGISSEVSVDELAGSTGIPANQVRARAAELVREHFAHAIKTGVYKANPHRIEQFLNGISKSGKAPTNQT